MTDYSRTLIGAGMATMFLTALVACGGGENTVPTVSTSSMAGNVSPSATVNACDGLRRHTRQQAMKDFGFDHMIDTMKRISREVSPEQREDLLRLTKAIDSSEGISPELGRQSAQTIQSIYADAIERDGLHPGAAETHGDIRRAIVADPTGYDPLVDGFTQVLSSYPTSTAVPAVGSVTNAFLGVSADQSRYEFFFIRIRSVSPAPNNGFEAKGETITMSQYIDSVLPSSCAQAGSTFPPDQLNRMSAD